LKTISFWQKLHHSVIIDLLPLQGDTVSEDSLPLTNAPVHEQDVVIGGRLRAMRKAQDLRLKHVAEQAGLSVSMLSQIERGISSPSIRVLRNICHALAWMAPPCSTSAMRPLRKMAQAQTLS